MPRLKLAITRQQNTENKLNTASDFHTYEICIHGKQCAYLIQVGQVGNSEISQKGNILSHKLFSFMLYNQILERTDANIVTISCIINTCLYTSTV